MKPFPKIYLGDGVYARAEDEFFILTTENGLQTTNTIYFDASTFYNLLDVIKVYQKKEKCDGA